MAKRLTPRELVARTNHVAPYYSQGHFNRCKRVQDAMTVIGRYNRGEVLLMDRARLERMAMDRYGRSVPR